jgi:hypothetical protein
MASCRYLRLKPSSNTWKPESPLLKRPLATILELARFAHVSAENVIRVVNGEPVSGEVESRVREALAALGPPPRPSTALEPRPLTGAAEEARRQLVETFAETAAGLEARLPEGVGNVVYEALRVEVRPVAHHMAQMGTLVEQLIRRFERVDIGVDLERRERLEDVALLTELITTGWRMVDRRLGRIERMLERAQAEAKTNGAPPIRHLRVDAPVEEPDGNADKSDS